MPQIEITKKAEKALQQLKSTDLNLIFHHCICENNKEGLILIPKEEMYLDDNEILLDSIFGIDYYMNIIQFHKWKNTSLTIDVEEGYGSTFSLEYDSGIRFIAKNNELELEAI